MTRHITLHFYEDPGHGWLKAPIKLLKELEIIDQISPYSYLHGTHAYLEEDCDAGKLTKALEQAGRRYVVVRHFSNNRSTIRSYGCFTAQRLANYAKAPAEGMRLSYGGNLLTMVRPTAGGAWYVESDHGMHYRMSRNQVMEAMVL